MWKIGRRPVRGNTFVPACVNLFQYREEITKWSQRCYTCSCQVATDGLRRIVQVSLSNLVTLEFNLSQIIHYDWTVFLLSYCPLSILWSGFKIANIRLKSPVLPLQSVNAMFASSSPTDPSKCVVRTRMLKILCLFAWVHFLAVHNSSIGGLVTHSLNHSVSHSVSHSLTHSLRVLLLETLNEQTWSWQIIPTLLHNTHLPT